MVDCNREKEKLKMEKICKNCGYYYEYYTKSYDHFNKASHGFCNSQRKIVNNSESCEKWKGNEKRQEARKRISLETLETSVKYIREIAQILRENE